MKITNNKKDLENFNQINYCLRFNNLMSNGEIYFDSCKHEEKPRLLRKRLELDSYQKNFWGYFFRKGFTIPNFEFIKPNEFKAIVQFDGSNQKVLKDIDEIYNDALKSKDNQYNLVGFKIPDKINLKDKETLECMLIAEFVRVSENQDLNIKKNFGFMISTHNLNELIYIPDGSDNGLDKEELGKQLKIKTFNDIILYDFVKESNV